MDSTTNAEWEACLETSEQPDDNGLCWCDTIIGPLAFKTTDEGTKLWYKFDEDGNGIQVVFDENGRPFWLHDGELIPIQLEEPDRQSQETFGQASAASQIGVLVGSTSPEEPQTTPELQLDGEKQTFPENVGSKPPEKDEIHEGLPQPQTENNEAPQSLQSSCEAPCPETPSFISVAADECETPKTVKKRYMRRPPAGIKGLNLTAVRKPATGVGELLSLWGETNTPEGTSSTEQAYMQQQLLVRLQQTEIPQRLTKVAEDEKGFSAAFDTKLTIINEEMERMQKTVTFAEQKLELCYEAHRAVAELQANILASWTLESVMQNVAQRAETFLRSAAHD